MRGYHPEDVDQFLERVAAGMEVLQDRLRQAMERTQRAEQAAAEAGGNDDTLRRTLVLAQRTADLAVQEAREQAARILAGAEQQAQALLADAEERAQRAQDDALMETKSELAKLEASRQHLQAEVDMLSQWVDEHRAHLSLSLQEALAHVEQADLLSPPPVSRGVDLPAGRADRDGRRRRRRPEPGRPPATVRAPTAARPTAMLADGRRGRPPAEGDDRPAGRPAEPRGDGDPYFAELRRASTSPSLSGPRDDDPAPSAGRGRR